MEIFGRIMRYKISKKIGGESNNSGADKVGGDEGGFVIKRAVVRMALGAILSLFLLACEDAPRLGAREKGALTGGALGAGLGAIVGNQVGNSGAGVAIGGAAGALAGGLIGNAQDSSDQATEEQEERLRRQEEELRRQRRELDELRRGDRSESRYDDRRDDSRRNDYRRDDFNRDRGDYGGRY